jgi:glutamyl/glutaminyl-tRNA synthetase
MKELIITRFAPSPTGQNGMHIGNLRTAYFSWLHARKNNGKFILRIEDTDKARSNDRAIKNIFKILNKTELDYDEFYKQSDRIPLYQYYIYELINHGFAYLCFCNKNKDDNICNCKSKEDKPLGKYCVRMNINAFNLQTIECYDEIRKSFIKFNTNELNDIVLIKSDGYPTYHLASVIDDHLMEITDVFRGDEWMSSFPYHILLYKALNWTPPRFYHLPLITNANGEKLSKRDGDFSVESLLKQGYLPSAILNYIVLLGWHPSSDDEIFDKDKTVKTFNAKRIKTSACKYDEKRLKKFNLTHARTEHGEYEFNKFLGQRFNLLCKKRLYNLFIKGIDIFDLMNKLRLNHSYSPLTLQQKEFAQFLKSNIENLDQYFYQMLSDENIKNIVEKSINAGYNNKEFHIWTRFFLTGEVQGLPGDVLLGLLNINQLILKLSTIC